MYLHISRYDIIIYSKLLLISIFNFFYSNTYLIELLFDLIGFSIIFKFVWKLLDYWI